MRTDYENILLVDQWQITEAIVKKLKHNKIVVESMNSAAMSKDISLGPFKCRYRFSHSGSDAGIAVSSPHNISAGNIKRTIISIGAPYRKFDPFFSLKPIASERLYEGAEILLGTEDYASLHAGVETAFMPRPEINAKPIFKPR